MCVVSDKHIHVGIRYFLTFYFDLKCPSRGACVRLSSILHSCSTVKRVAWVTHRTLGRLLVEGKLEYFAVWDHVVGKRTFAGLHLGMDGFIVTLMRVFNCVIGSFDIVVYLWMFFKLPFVFNLDHENETWVNSCTEMLDHVLLSENMLLGLEHLYLIQVHVQHTYLCWNQLLYRISLNLVIYIKSVSVLTNA